MSHADKLLRLKEEIAAAGSAPLGLSKDTSNLFRDRKAVPKHKLDVRQFNEVLAVNAEERWVEAEGMTPYVKLVDAMLAEGVMPAVVPQLKSITLGGAAAVLASRPVRSNTAWCTRPCRNWRSCCPTAASSALRPTTNTATSSTAFPIPTARSAMRSNSGRWPCR